MSKKEEARRLVQELYKIVDRLREIFPGRPFTPDGHLVGSLGEALAAAAYDLELLPNSSKTHDARASDGRLVQIKATQVRAISIYAEPDYLIVLRLRRDGTFEDVYNGPGAPAMAKAGSLQKNGQRRISLSALSEVMKAIPRDQRIGLADADV